MYNCTLWLYGTGAIDLWSKLSSIVVTKVSIVIVHEMTPKRTFEKSFELSTLLLRFVFYNFNDLFVIFA